MSRREMLKRCGCGFGGLALSSLLQRDVVAATPRNPLAPKVPHFAPRAKRIIFLHMHGGPSQHDLFEYKPLLVRDDNKPLPFAKPSVQFNETGNLFKSPWEFQQHGQSGAWVSELTTQRKLLYPSTGMWSPRLNRRPCPSAKFRENRNEMYASSTTAQKCDTSQACGSQISANRSSR